MLHAFACSKLCMAPELAQCVDNHNKLQHMLKWTQCKMPHLLLAFSYQNSDDSLKLCYSWSGWTPGALSAAPVLFYPQAYSPFAHSYTGQQAIGYRRDINQENEICWRMLIEDGTLALSDTHQQKEEQKKWFLLILFKPYGTIPNVKGGVHCLCILI